MTEFLESRRGFLGRAAGVGILGGLVGCTVVGAVGVDFVVENTGTREERTEYSLDRAGTTTETVDLEAEETFTTSLLMERGDAVVVSKGELGFECTLDDYFCRNPALQVDTGFGMLAVSAECFTTDPW